VTRPVLPHGRPNAADWTVRCESHSDPDGGIHVFACGVPQPCRWACPCVVGDRYLVVEAVHSGRRWWHSADVLICAPQSGRSAALLATSVTLARLPGCTLAVASFRDSGCAVRTQNETVLVSSYPVEFALLAAYAHQVNTM